MKKRVLHFISSFNQGGTERQAIALTRALKSDGEFDVLAATLNSEGSLREEIDAIALAEIPEFPLSSFYGPNFLRQVQRCVRYLRSQKVDVVHTHDFYTNVFGMAAATVAGVPVRIASKRETVGMRTRAQRYVERIAFGRADAIVANAEAVKAHLTGRGVAAEKIRVIFNGFDQKRFGAKGDRCLLLDKLCLPVDPGIRLIAMVANLRHDVKYVPMLLRTAKRVVEKASNVHFVVAGEGQLRGELETLAGRLNISDVVHFLGRCDDVPALLDCSFACVLTSAAEGFSNSILEYMAAGKPVVATTVGAAAEVIVDGETGYLVASDDDAAMAERLTELLQNESFAQRLGTTGRRVVNDRFSEDKQLAATVGLYRSLLK